MGDIFNMLSAISLKDITKDTPQETIDKSVEYAEKFALPIIKRFNEAEKAFNSAITHCYVLMEKISSNHIYDQNDQISTSLAKIFGNLHNQRIYSTKRYEEALDTIKLIERIKAGYRNEQED